MQEGVDPLLVGLDASDEVFLEARHTIAQNPNTVQQVPDKDRLEDVKLKLPAHARDRHRRMVPHHLRTNHRHSLTLRGVDLPRHDRRARLVLREVQFAQSAAGSGAQESNILCDFEERAGEGVEGAGGLDDGVVRGEGFELVRGGLEVGAGHFADFGGDGFGKAFEGVETGSYCGASLCEEAEVR